MSACPHLGVLPPVFILQFCSACLKLRGSGLQGIGPVIQFRQLLITLQNLIHVYAHDVHHLWRRDEEQSDSRTELTHLQGSDSIWAASFDENVYRWICLGLKSEMVVLTSSTCAWVCCRRRLLVRLGGCWGAPPSVAGAPVAGADLWRETYLGPWMKISPKLLQTNHWIPSAEVQMEVKIIMKCIGTSSNHV